MIANNTSTTSAYVTNAYSTSNTISDDTCFIGCLASKDTPVKTYTVGDMTTSKSRKSLTVVDVKILAPGKVVAVTFDDGSTEKAVCHESDEFSLETGIAVCLAKHAMGGSSEYNKAVKKAVKVYEDKLAKEKAEAEEKARREKRRVKHQAYLKRRDEKKREGRIEEMAEAYRRAMGN